MSTPEVNRSPSDGPLILVTGAAGYLGSILRTGLSESYRLRLTDRAPLPTPLGSGEDYCRADLEDADAVESAMRGIHTVVHLGGILRETAPWSAILSTNIAGTYNVFESARRCGVRRVVFASSHHVVGYYRREHRLGADVSARPDSRYAASKVFGEALGRLYADKHGLSVICQRIGVARPRPPHRRSLSNWLSERDYVELTRCCIAAEGVHFLTLYAVSDSSESFYDTSTAASIGFRPRDSADAYRAEVLEKSSTPEPPLEKQFQGGHYTALEFDGDPDRID
jgi:uronate dehydrogenase